MKTCPRCGASNNDENQRCCVCGTELFPADTNQSYSPYQNYNQNYNPNYNRNYTGNGYYQGYGNPFGGNMPVPKITKNGAIARLVLGILFGGIIGMIFGILTYTSYSDYESALLRGNAFEVNQKIESVNRNANLTILFIIISSVLKVLTGVIYSFMVIDYLI